MDAQGNLYGVTYFGGAFNQGAVFEVAAGSNAATTLGSIRWHQRIQSAVGCHRRQEWQRVWHDGAGRGQQGRHLYEIAAGSGTVTTLASFGPLTAGTTGGGPGHGR